MARVEITVAELLETVKSATGAHMNPDDAFTVSEISEALGNSRQLTCRKLNTLKRARLIEMVKVSRERLDGMTTIVPAYRFLKPKKAAR